MVPILKKIEIGFLCLVILVCAIVIDKYVVSLRHTEVAMTVERRVIDVKQLATYYYYLNQFRTFAVLHPLVTTHTEELAQDVPVLVYHGSASDTSEGEDVSTKTIQDQLFALKQNGWNTISIEDYYAFMQGKKELPKKSFLLTFDDGKKSSYYPLDPILKVLDYKAVMYVITSHIISTKSSKYYLGVGDLQDMLDSGRWELQSHSRYGHNYSVITPEGKSVRFIPNKSWLSAEGRYETDAEYKERLYDDMLGAKNDIETIFNVKNVSFAFPFGDYGQSASTSPIVLDVVSSIYPINFIQFRTDETQGYYRSNFPELGFSLSRRIKVPASYSGAKLVQMLEASTALSLPYTEDFKNNQRWIFNPTVSDVSISGGSMKMTTGTTTASVGAYLDGSELWKNYFVEAQVDLTIGNAISMIARYTNGHNYISCSFGNDHAILQETYKGITKKLAETPKDFKFDENKKSKVGIFLDGTTSACLIDGVVVTMTSKINSKISFGGIGIKASDKLPGAKMAVKTLLVVPVDNSMQKKLANYVEDAKRLADIQNQIVLSKKNTTSSVPAIVLPFDALLLYDPNGSIIPLKIVDFNTITNNIKKLYGVYDITDSGLAMTTEASTTSSMILVKGTDTWNNFQYSVTVDWHKGSSFTLVTNAQDSKNYIGCNYSYQASYATLFQVKDGVQKKLGTSPRLSVPYFDSWHNIRMGIRIVGNQVSCLSNDAPVITGEVTPPKAGSIGFAVWDKTKGGVNIIVRQLDAEVVQ